MKLPSWLRSPIGRRLFIAFALVWLIASALTAWAIERSGRQATDRRAKEVLARTQSVQSLLQGQRFETLELAGRLVAVDPFLLDRLAPPAPGEEAAPAGEASPLLEGPGSVELGSDRDELVDLLRQRGEERGVDLTLLLGADGRVLAASDGRVSGAALGQDPILSRLEDRRQSAAFWNHDGGTWSAVAFPMLREFDLVGHLIVARAVDDELARTVGAASVGDIVFFTLGSGAPEVVGSSRPPGEAEALALELRRSGSFEGALTDGRLQRVDLGDETWLALPVPLRDAEDTPVAAAVSLVSESALMAPFRRLTWLAIFLGLLGPPIAALLAGWVVRRVDRPSAEAAAALAEARQEGRRDVEELDALGPLGDEVSALLRQRAGRRATLQELGPRLERAASGVGVDGEARAGEPVLVEVENRSLAASSQLQTPRRALERLERDRERLHELARELGGRLEESWAHRTLLSFDGEGAPERALLAAGRAVARLSTPESAVEAVEPACAALTRGRVVRRPGAGDRSAAVGPGVRLVSAIAREAGPGEIVLSRALWEELSPVLSEAGAEASEQRGVLSPQPLFVLSATDAERAAAQAPGVGSAARSALMPGTTLEGRWSIRRLLGDGHGGPLWEAFDRELDQRVALRRLSSDRLDEVRERLEILQRSPHPGLARCFELDETREGPVLVRRLVSGLDWRRLADPARPLGAVALVHLLAELGAALVALHHQGLVHGHLGAGDVIVGPAGSVVITDSELPPGDSADSVATVADDVRALGRLAALALGVDPDDGRVQPFEGLSPELAGWITRCLGAEDGPGCSSVQELLELLERIE